MKGETHRVRPEALATLRKYGGRDVSEGIALMEAKIRTLEDIVTRLAPGRGP